MPAKKSKRKTSAKKQKKLSFWKRVKEKFFSGIFSGFEDFIKKATLSLLGAITIIIATFAITNMNVFKGDLFGNIFTQEFDLQNLIHTTSSGGTIVIPEGKYTLDTITLTKNVILEGAGRVVITGEENSTLFTVEKDKQVTISNITFQDADTAIQVQENANVTIKNSIFKDNSVAILIENAQDILIENCYFEGSGESAIRVVGLMNGVVQKNTFSRNRIGFYADSSKMVISENIFKNSTENAIYLFSDESVFQKNIIRNMLDGVGVNFRKGIHTSQFQENHFLNMPIAFYEIGIADTSAVTVTGNVFTFITENIFILPNTPESNFRENISDDIGNLNYIEGAGCTMRDCF